MKKTKLIAGLLLTVLLTLALALPAAAQVEPPVVEKELAPGASMMLIKEVTTPPIPPVIDIFLLEDETGSFWDDIDELQALAPAIWDAIAASGADFTMGVAGFRDFDQDGWGSTGDHVYRLVQDLTSDKDDFVAGVGNLSAWGGNDGPEAQLEALHYLAVPTHPWIDSDGDGVMDPEDTPTGQQPTWRDGAQRVVLLATDASCHLQGDPPAPPGWPGCAATSSANVTGDLLKEKEIIVIGLTPLGAGTISCIDILAAKTGGSVQATTATGEEILEAILAGLKELTTDVWWEVEADPGLTVELEPTVHYDVPGDTTVEFAETITLDEDAPQCHTLTATVTFYANEYPEEGAVIGEQEISIHVADITPPCVACREWVNPHGNKVPPAGWTTEPGTNPNSGRNPDGFYQLGVWDNCDEDPMIYVSDLSVSAVFGPFPHGTVVKITEDLYAAPECKKIGSSRGRAGAVAYHIILQTDAVIWGVDDYGNVSTVLCLVPPPPK